MRPLALVVKHRLKDLDTDNDWVTRRMPVGPVKLEGLPPGTYDLELRYEYAGGRLSQPRLLTHTVAAPSRRGALALPPSAAANLPSVWDYDTEVVYNATDSTATIIFEGGTLKSPDGEVVYGPSSATIAVVPEETFTLYLWINDPWMEGGTLPLEVSRNFMDTIAPGNVALPKMTLTAPPIGGTSSGGGNVGGGGGGGGGNTSPEQAPL